MDRGVMHPYCWMTQARLKERRWRHLTTIPLEDSTSLTTSKPMWKRHVREWCPVLIFSLSLLVTLLFRYIYAYVVNHMLWLTTSFHYIT